MDFIERLFGVSPDGGNGTTEAVIVLVLIAAVLSIICMGLVVRGSRRSAQSQPLPKFFPDSLS